MRTHHVLPPCLGILLYLLLIPSTPAHGHKVMIFAYQEQGRVHAEGYFADGKKAQDSLVEVFAKDGTRLLEGKTDDKGLISFPMPDAPEIRIVLTASMGHRAECTLKGDTLEDATPGGLRQDQRAGGAIGEERIRAIVSEELDRKIAPLAREVARLHRRGPSLTDIIGGIGYIAGIMGLLVYFKTRRKDTT